jgi:hypothetical protein
VDKEEEEKGNKADETNKRNRKGGMKGEINEGEM